MFPESRLSALEALVVIAVVLAYGYVQLSYALSIEDYVSDEIWYVSSSRNYLNKVFGVRPRAADAGYRMTLELAATGRSDYVEKAARLSAEVERLGGRVVKSSEYYGSGTNPLYAICADVPEEAVEALTSHPYVRSFGFGYCYPNAGNILNYMNLEHPPLGKYLIALSMVVCGDRPVCWRLPSIASGAAILVLQYALLRSVLGGPWGGIVAVLVPLVTLFDRTFRSMTLVAMLDAPLALLTYAACLLALRGRIPKSAAFLSLAFSTKFSGAFLVPALYPDYSRRRPPAYAMLLLAYAPLAVFLALSVPLMIFRGGFLQWWSEGVEGAVRWHLSTKVEPGRGPPSASPWDWLAGANSFVLRYRCEEGVGCVADLVASGNPVLYVATTLLSVYAIPRLRRLPDGGRTWTYTWATWLMYVLLWFAGNRSQYSFYMVQLTPLLYTTLGVLVYHLSDLDNLRELSRAWLEILKSLLRYLLGEVSLRIRVEVETGSGSTVREGAGGSAVQRSPAHHGSARIPLNTAVRSRTPT